MDAPDESGRRPKWAGRRGGVRKPPSTPAVVGHEIRGPLGVVITIAEMLLARDLGAEERRLVELLRLAGSHALGVAEDLVAEAGLEAENLRVQDEPFDPGAMVTALASLWAPLANGTHRVDVICAPDLPATMVSDEGRIRQILFNLLSNATRHSAPGTIFVRASATTDAIAFEVDDPGGGLRAVPPAGARPGASNGGGLGIGLWIAHRLADALGGTLSFSQLPDGGTSARLALPLAPSGRPRVGGPGPGERPKAKRSLRRPKRTVDAPPPQAPAPTDRRSPAPVVPAAPPPTADWPLARMTVLVVDDSAVSRMLMAAVLSSFDMRVSTVSSGRDAAIFVAVRRPDVVVVDWSLEAETGAEVVAKIAGVLGDAMPPVVLVTANAAPAAMPNVAAVVRKPFSPGEMFDALTTTVSQRPAVASAG